MNRDDAFIKILEASGGIQRQVALILEAKADEAVKSRNWICAHVTSGGFQDHDHQLRSSLEAHEHIVALISSLAKLEGGLARNMQVVLGQDANSVGDLGGDFSLFDQGEMKLS